MIRTGAAASAAIAIVGLAALVGAGSPDPAVEIAAERLVHERAAVALAALDDLRAALQPGLEAARGAAADVLVGDEPPGPALEEAAGLIEGAEAAVLPMRRAVSSLAAARAAWHPDAPPTADPIAAGELSSIAAQLRASAPVADAFATRRERALGLPAVLEGALDGLEAGDLEAAADMVVRARTDHDAVVRWETDLLTLPVWIETMDAMISAVERILDAARAGDATAAREAADDLAALGDDAATADRALRIALSEGGSSLTSAPLERLAAALGSIEAARSDAAAALAATGS